MSSEPVHPLSGDPRRQADDLFRGCEYQVWQTVSAWLRLSPEELLFVEGAEDFDVVAPDAAVTTQVKNAVQPVSLRSKDVQDAIRHYWELRTAHSGMQISLRFLTRATIAEERGAPFGQGVAGLRLWMLPKITDEQCRALADFLISLDRVGQDLRQWLPVASPAQIREELINGITWEAFAEAVEHVERAVKRKLAAMGETRGVLPSVASRIAGRLFDEIWKTLRKKDDRFVDRLLLDELWERETHLSVPHADYQIMVRALATRTVQRFVEPFKKGAPPFAGVVAQRWGLVDEIHKQLRSSGFLHIHGSTRMGKTTLAKLIVGRDETQPLWWSAPRLPGHDIARALRGLTYELDAQSDSIFVVLDDLDFTPATALEFEEALGEMVATIRGHRGSLLITSHKPLPPGFRHAFGLSADQVIAVPALSKGEVAEIATGLGCPDRFCQKWSAIVRAHTAGHPHLVAVQLLAMQRVQWPAPTAQTLNTLIGEVDAEKNEARQLLNSLPQEQREALYRLSVFPNVFRRDHAISVVSCPPPLPLPGDLFDPLLGPWIEPLHTGYFALSPLFSGCAKQVFPAAEVRKLQANALRVLHECEPRTLFEGSSVFRLAWELQDLSELARFVLGWSSLDEDSRRTWAEYLAWFIFEGRRPGEQLFPSSPTISFLLRKYQCDLAINARPKHAMLVYRSWRMEAASRDLSAFERATISMSALPYSEIPLSGSELVLLLGELAVAIADNPNLAVQLPTSPDLPEFSYISDINDTVSTCGLFVCWRCKTIQFLDELLEGLGTVPLELRTRILNGFAGSEAHLRLAISRTWMAEAEREAPDWNRCLSVYAKAYEFGLAWGFKELALAAIGGIAVVQDEYLHDPAAAHATINRLASKGDLNSHQIDDRRANIYFNEGKFTEAEAYWHSALSRWPKPTIPYDQSAAFAARCAGVAAGKMERWEAASAWFTQVQQLLPEPKDRPFLAGALADAAYAHWKSGHSKQAVIAAIEAWEIADSLSAKDHDGRLRVFAARKTVGHVIAWLHGARTEIGVANLREPTAGMCSNPGIPEKIRELAPTESAGVWLLLMRMERKYNAGDKAARLGGACVEASTSILMRPLVVEETITRNLLTGEVADLPQRCIEFVRAAWDLARSNPELPLKMASGKEPEMFHREDSSIGAALFLAGVVSAAAIGLPWSTLLGSWRASVLTNRYSKDWNDWFDEIEHSLCAAPSSAMTLIKSGAGRWETVVLGVLNILLAQSCSPEDLFAAHGRLLQAADGSHWFSEIEEAICNLLERAWIRTLESPALLRQPRLSVPEIRASCSAAGSGLPKAARILLTARSAVTALLGPQLLAVIEKLAQQQPR